MAARILKFEKKKKKPVQPDVLDNPPARPVTPPLLTDLFTENEIKQMVADIDAMKDREKK